MKYLLAFVLLFSSVCAQNSPKIVIIGAGFSGLTAAYRLQEMGVEAYVYEARNRVGGRVFTVNIQGHLSELGAQNIRDGGEAKNLLTLVAECGLTVESKKTPYRFNYYDKGNLVDISSLIKEQQYSRNDLKTQLEQIAQETHNMQEVLLKLFDPENILFKACSVFLSSYEGAPVEELSSLYIQTLYHILTGSISAAHQNQSDEEPYYEHLWIREGNGRLATKLAEKLKHPVQLNHVLAAVTKTTQGSYLLSFENGKNVFCDILILTMPCTVYEDISIPNDVIPTNRLNAIKEVTYGTNAKILVPVASPKQKRAVYTNGRMVTFFNISEHILNLYYTRNWGYFTEATINDTFQEDLSLLNDMYVLPFSQSPVLAADAAFAFYDGPVGQSWPLDRFSKGSYSCVGQGQEETFTTLIDIEGEWVKRLFAPIDKTLFFAGEHTSILLNNAGTMEAAVESGERMARLVKKLML